MAPKLKSAHLVSISEQDLCKVKKTIADSVFKSADTKLTVNPFAKAMSTLTITSASDIDTTYTYFQAPDPLPKLTLSAAPAPAEQKPKKTL